MFSGLAESRKTLVRALTAKTRRHKPGKSVEETTRIGRKRAEARTTNCGKALRTMGRHYEPREGTTNQEKGQKLGCEGLRTGKKKLPGEARNVLYSSVTGKTG